MKSRLLKATSIYLAINILLEAFYPTAAFALTGGPSQPEVQSFEPVGTSEMVDLFSGDFTYNIPLLDVEGYPVNISYHGGITMDQEASWVGLGWNINPGVINRNMRGIPDDFDGSKGDKITNTLNTRPNRTYGIKGTLGLELFGLQKNKKAGKKGGTGTLSFGVGIQFNNYKGISVEQSVSAKLAVSQSSKGSLNAGLGLTSSNNGLSIKPSVSYSSKQRQDRRGDDQITSSTSGGISSSFNSRTGLKAVSLDFNRYRSLNGSYDSKNELEERKHDLSYPSNGGSSITFGVSTYAPPIMMPTSSSSVTFSAKGGGTFFGLDGTYNLTGYYAEQKLRHNTESVPAYGYFNSEKAANLKMAMHDFNREKDGPFSANTPALPLTNYTYDVYAVSGQGVGGMYRPYRSEIGHVYDRSVSNTSDSYSLGLEIAGGNAVKGGLDVTVVDVYTKSGMWESGNDARRNFSFKKAPTDVVGYEKFYFKEAGEKSVDAEYKEDIDPNKKSFFEKAHKFDAVRLDLVKRGGLEVGIASRLVDQNGQAENVSEPIYRKKRQKRNQAIYFLTVSEAKRFAVDPSPFNSTDPEKQVSASAKPHHIGEITALKPDGSRYVYGIPAYNSKQQEVTFATGGIGNVSGLNPDANGLVTYSSTDDGLSNNKGIDNYYQKTEIPGYAHSYLLTSVLSSDYIDNDPITGPSRGDMGSYTRFNYEKVNSDYKWRIPVGSQTANYNEGLLSINTDDKANYLYGEKELWYLQSIESKNYIAIFETATRADGLGVENKDGALNQNLNQGSRLLRDIKLYLLEEYKANPTSAVPLKTVHFEYDYSLCKGISNNILRESPSSTTDPSGFTNQGGKLTLKKIYITYQNSNKGRFSPYSFDYGTENPDYSPKAYDRWGNYKPLINGDFRMNAIEPYVEQNKNEEDNYVKSWNLKKMDLPSGGSIQVEYESDDYAYVQDRPAMQMFKVTGILKDENAVVASDELYDASSWISSNGHNLALQVDVPAGTTTADFKAKYLRGIQYLYFKFAVDMTRNGQNYEMVPGYAEIDYDNCKVVGNKGIVLLKAVGLGEKANKGLKVNPITKAALQYSRLYTPEHAFNQPDRTEGGIEQVLKALINSDFTQNIKAMLLGINGDLLSKGHCAEVDLNRCYVRLLSPYKKKLGGGYRVKSVKINDGADKFDMGDDFEYGQVYEYETVDNSGEIISSGVASYEPMLGGEENPFRLPIPFGTDFQQKLLVPDDRYYMEGPLGESFFPAPSVGYSKVTVRSYKPSGVNIKRNGTGKIVHEFYTAKDFPIITRKTDLQVIPKKSPMVFKLLKISQKDYLYASQGFAVELNDMHGKPKAQWSYAEGQNTPVTGIEYKYKCNGNRLNNEATIVDKMGNVHTATIGVDFDMVVDTREQETESNSYGLNGNLAVFLAAILPASIPMILPAYSKDHTRFKSASVTKVINRSGILEETIAHDLGSVVSTKNLAFDAETGELLLKETKNDFDAPVYSFTYPAHWAYDQMGQAYRNIMLEFELNFDQGEASPERGEITTSDIQEFFSEGDELVILSNEFSFKPEVQEEIKNKFWVVLKDTNRIYVMGGARENHCRYPLNGETRFKIIRSGRRNQQNTPIGAVVSLINPIHTTENGTLKIDFKSLDYQVLSSGATEYSEDWRAFCACGLGPGDFSNPYYEGRRGRWRMKSTHTYLTGRKQTVPQAKLKEDGVFTSYSPFWVSPAEGLPSWSRNTTDGNWKWVNEITNYDPYSGNEIENINPLGIYSAAVNGYNHSVPVSTAPNARYSELFNDNFEDYDINSCNEDLSKFNGGNSGNLDFKSHTGRKSIKVSKTGSNITLSIIPPDCEN